MEFDWSFISDGVTTDMPRTTGPECQDYMSNTRRCLEGLIISALCVLVLRWCHGRLHRIQLPSHEQIERRHSSGRLCLLFIMTLTFGIELGFKFANRSMIFILNPCHIQTLIQIYLLAAKPTKTTTALFRLQMNNLNGTLLSFLFPEVDCRKLPFEQATYWIQHAMLYIIPVYILQTETYQIEDLKDYNWAMMGMAVSLLYHFALLNGISIMSGINLNHMLCAAESDPFDGPNYRLAAVIHESLLCPLLNKVTVYAFKKKPIVQQQRQHNVVIVEQNHRRFPRRLEAALHYLPPYHRQGQQEPQQQLRPNSSRNPNTAYVPARELMHSVGTQVRVRKHRTENEQRSPERNQAGREHSRREQEEETSRSQKHGNRKGERRDKGGTESSTFERVMHDSPKPRSSRTFPRSRSVDKFTHHDHYKNFPEVSATVSSHTID